MLLKIFFLTETKMQHIPKKMCEQQSTTAS